MILSGKRVGLLSLSVVLLGTLISTSILGGKAFATGQLTSRSLTLGSSASNAATSWTFKFSGSSAVVLEGISFEVCTTAAPTESCTVPNAWSNTTVGFTSLTYNGSSQSGWVLDNTGAGGANFFGIKNNSASNSSANPIVATFNVTNPTTTNQTFYVRITTFTGATFTSPKDAGSVAASTANQITLTGYMPESLIFCAGATVGTTNSVPDCSTATPGSVSFPDFSPAATSTAISQMAASTNANSGYAITYSGATMTSGGNTITPADNGSGGATTSSLGKSQFGLDLVANDGSAYAGAPDVTGSANISPASNVTDKLLANQTANYATAGSFYFTTSGDTVAQSDYGGTYGVAGTLGPTDAQIYTVSYIVNVDGAQPVGTYTTTLTYICTATY